MLFFLLTLSAIIFVAIVLLVFLSVKRTRRWEPLLLLIGLSSLLITNLLRASTPLGELRALLGVTGPLILEISILLLLYREIQRNRAES